MPNHITNELTAHETVLDTLATPERIVDFNRLVPMPQILAFEPDQQVIDLALLAMGIVTIASLQLPTPDPRAAFERGDYGAASKRLQQIQFLQLLSEGPFVKDLSDERFIDWLQCCRAIKETGYPSFYDWSVEHWGTKWNAYQAQRVSPTVVIFQTAWSAPLPLLTILTGKYPERTMRLRWADEDFGCNAGDITVHGGEIVAGGRLENNSTEAQALALELLYAGELPDHMRRNVEETLCT